MSRLNEIEARARKAALMIDIGPTSEKEWAACASACNDAPALVAALRAVLELHAPTPSDIYPHDVCHHPHCTDPTDQMEQSPWPCPTVTAIRRHLGDDL